MEKVQRESILTRMATNTLNRLLTAAEVAELLNVKIQTLALWRCTGKGPAFVRIGSKIGYDPAAISTWTASRTYSSTAAAAGPANA